MHEIEVASTANPCRDALNSWLQAFNAKDAESLFALYDPEAVYANDGAPLMRGLDEIRPWFEEVFETQNAVALFQEEALFQGTDLGLIVGKFYTKFLDPSGGEASGETGRVTLVFRRAEEDRWLLLLDMDNRPPDVRAEDFA